MGFTAGDKPSGVTASNQFCQQTTQIMNYEPFAATNAIKKWKCWQTALFNSLRASIKKQTKPPSRPNPRCWYYRFLPCLVSKIIRKDVAVRQELDRTPQSRDGWLQRDLNTAISDRIPCHQTRANVHWQRAQGVEEKRPGPLQPKGRRLTFGKQSSSFSSSGGVSGLRLFSSAQSFSARPPYLF